MSKLNIMTIGDVDNVIAMFGLTGKINSVTTSYYNENTGHSILSIFGCKRNTRGILSVKLVVENQFREINQDMTFDIQDQAFANKCIVNLKDQIEKHNQTFDEFNITKDFENMELPPLISMPHDEFKNHGHQMIELYAIQLAKLKCRLLCPKLLRFQLHLWFV